MRKSVILMLVLKLLGRVTMGQATAQILRSDGTQAMVSQDGRITVRTFINRWVIKYRLPLEAAFQRRKRPGWVSWRLGETYIRVKG